LHNKSYPGTFFTKINIVTGIKSHDLNKMYTSSYVTLHSYTCRTFL